MKCPPEQQPDTHAAIQAVVPLIVAEAREILSSGRWNAPDSPASETLTELHERLASPDSYAAFRASPGGPALLEIIEAYEAAFNEDWLPYSIGGLPIDQSRPLLEALVRLLETNEPAVAAQRLESLRKELAGHA